MSTKEKEALHDSAQSDERPPSFAEQAGDELPPEYCETQEPPDYPGRRIESATRLSRTCTPYRSFPPTIKAIFKWKHWKSFQLCDGSSKEPLFHAQINMGVSGHPPLGVRPGIHLHNGLSVSEPVLSAAGDERMGIDLVPSLERPTVVLLPPLEPARSTIEMDTEKLRGAASKMYEATYSFSIEVGEKMRQESFVWRKVQKNRYNLVRLFKRNVSEGEGEPSAAEASGSGSGMGTRGPGSSSEGDGGETIAVWTYVPRLTTLNKLFTLELMGSAQTGELGDRCMLMIVTTALRLWFLHYQIKTT